MWDILDFGITETNVRTPWEVGQKVKLNDSLKARFPNSFDYDATYEIYEVVKLQDGSYSYIVSRIGSTENLTIHETHLDKIGLPKKCECSIHDLMVQGCKCNGC